MKKIRKILIIDDDSTTAFLHKRFLDNMQVAEEVAYMTDPHQALAYVRSNYGAESQTTYGHDIIFLDLEMPGLNGFQFLEELKSNSIDRSRVSIIMLTASVHPEYKERATTTYKNKLDGFTQKPLRADYVNDLVSRFESKLQA